MIEQPFVERSYHLSFYEREPCDLAIVHPQKLAILKRMTVGLINEQPWEVDVLFLKNEVR